MTLLYIGYWGYHDGLTQSTILPHLQILSEFAFVENILFTTMERGEAAGSQDTGISKVHHLPIPTGTGIWSKFSDFTTLPRRLSRIAREEQVDRIICRGAPAGALGYLVFRKTGIPYYVESFEPHADYMLESGVWKSYSLRYRLQRYWEKKQKQTASGLLPVSFNYRQQLIDEGIAPEKIRVIPCCTPLGRFAFSETKRRETRRKIGATEDELVGIYVGKFGGIYYKEEAFGLFAEAFRHFGRFRLVILTPDEQDSIRKALQERGVPLDRTFITRAPHAEVPAYLSAADFAFSTIKMAPVRRFCSPVKDGEYWASGLPILLPDGVGDDSDIIKTEGGGVVWDLSDTKGSLEKMKQLVAANDREAVAGIARKHRSFSIAQEVYRDLFSEKSV